jgi:DNA-binding protein HU-beta
VNDVYKNDVVRKVAQDTRLSQRVVGDALNSAVQVIGQALRDGKTVTFPGFGTFYTSHRGEGTVKHIRTKEPITVPARRVAAFRVGELLKQSVRTANPAKHGRRSRLGFMRGGK